MFIRSLILLAVCSLIFSCSSIEKSQNTSFKIGTQLLAGKNDIVLSVDQMRDLENAVGKADIFGRQTKEGETVVRYAGVEPNGEVILYRNDIKIHTNETTMSRMGYSSSTSNTDGSVNTSIYGNNVNSSVTARTTTTSTNPVDDYHVFVPQGSVKISLEPDERLLPISGYIIEILNATENSLTYIIRKQ